MKRIGLLGGMSWESSVTYYRNLNELASDHGDEFTSASLILDSVDFSQIEQLQRTDQWDEAGVILAERARALEAAGAQLLGLCTNTMHIVADHIVAATSIPFIDILDATSQVCIENQWNTVGLLGTSYTMTDPYFANRYSSHGLHLVIPNEDDRSEIQRVIFEELCQGVVREASVQRFTIIIGDLVNRGAQAVILGCTEIGLMFPPDADSVVPLLDTTRIHCQALWRSAIES